MIILPLMCSWEAGPVREEGLLKSSKLHARDLKYDYAERAFHSFYINVFNNRCLFAHIVYVRYDEYLLTKTNITLRYRLEFPLYSFAFT
jgi:hypothetical protein